MEVTCNALKCEYNQGTHCTWGGVNPGEITDVEIGEAGECINAKIGATGIRSAHDQLTQEARLDMGDLLSLCQSKLSLIQWALRDPDGIEGASADGAAFVLGEVIDCLDALNGRL